MNLYDRFRHFFANLIKPSSFALRPSSLSSASAQVDDSEGWMSLTGRPHDYDHARVYELYNDTLTAWRRNPIAWRIIGITTDYVVGDSFEISSGNRSLSRFISQFWNHPKNRLQLRLQSMCDELSRSGDLFVLLFRNQSDGLSYMRFITKDRIVRIETASNDWENELVYYEQRESGNPKRWYSPSHERSSGEDAIMLHYAVNRPIGALLGESDLTSMIPWLQRYSRMLEDRVRLHWAVRAFLWIVTVPSNKVAAKREQYRTPPEAGTIVVKDPSEHWDVITPTLHGGDAAHDLRAVRGMIDAGSGYPPHWRGESGEANLATATAMQAPTERHLLRRQQYFTFVLKDIIYHAYARSVEIGRARRLSSSDYSKLFTVSAPDISRSDNEALARSTREIMAGLQMLASQLPGRSESFTKQMLRMAFKFAGEPQTEADIEQIYHEAEINHLNPKTPGGQGSQ
jgi:hypothetical protein